MNARGFSIIELVVVLVLVSVLLAIAALDFGSWQRKSNVERQVKELFADIQIARMSAAFTKSRQGVEVTTARQVTFISFSSASDATGTVRSRKNLTVDLTTSTWTQPTARRIDFNTDGVMSDPAIKVLCIPAAENTSYDALIITPVLTSMGKMINQGAGCAQTNVTQK